MSPVCEKAVGGELLPGLFRHAPVADEDVLALDLDAADLAGLHRRAAGADYSQRRARQRKTDGAAAPFALVGIRGEHAALGHAVALEYRVAGARLEFVEGFLQQRRRTGDEQAHVAADIATEGRLVQQAHIEGRHAHHHGGFGSSCMARAASNFGSKNIAEPLSSTQ
jgi:hypothetical protein